MLQFLGSSSRTTQAVVLSFLLILVFLTYPTYRNYQEVSTPFPEPQNAAKPHYTADEVEESVVNPSTTPTASKLNAPTPVPPGASVDWSKPKDLRVIGLIFYGRASRVEVLNCYLERNLPEQGGWLDEVHFVRNTDKLEDLSYLEELVASNPWFKIVDIDAARQKVDPFSASWELLERDAIYVKIDDDVVFIADDTIPRIVKRKIENSEYLLVSANLINSPLMSKVHYDNGAYRPYLPVHNSTPPEIYTQFEVAQKAGQTHWEYTHYPTWTGPENYTLEWDTKTDGLSPVWLRMPYDHDILRTPVRDVTYATWGPGCMSWSISAQSHLSLLENLYHENTTAYHEALQEIWFTDYERLSINLIAVDSNEILAQLPVDADVVDEEWITVVLPKRLGKHVAVETQALAAHFSFSFQNAVEYTDVLDRYVDYAAQKVCLSQDQIGVPIFDTISLSKVG